MRVYHYTTSECLSSIIANNKFHPSAFITSDYSRYGTGWYFTDLPPATNIITLLYNLWRITENPWTYIWKAKSYLEFDIDDRYLELCRTNVYRLKDEYISSRILDLNLKYNEKLNGKIVIQYIRFGNI